MIDFFKDVFQYHNYFNQKLLDEIKRNELQLPERTYPLLCHVVNAHQIWTARILNERSIGVMDVHSFDSCRMIDRDNYATTLKILSGRKMDEKIFYKNTKGQIFSNSVQEILFHASNHATHHKGQIVSDFRLAGIEPIITDYIYYKR